MAKANKLKLVATLIEAEIENATNAVDSEATTGHYGKASGWQKYIEGLEKALSYVRVMENKERNETKGGVVQK